MTHLLKVSSWHKTYFGTAQLSMLCWRSVVNCLNQHIYKSSCTFCHHVIPSLNILHSITAQRDRVLPIIMQQHCTVGQQVGIRCLQDISTLTDCLLTPHQWPGPSTASSQVRGPRMRSFTHTLVGWYIILPTHYKEQDSCKVWIHWGLKYCCWKSFYKS